MKSSITKDQVLSLAKLTKLSLSNDEIEQYTKEISDLLEYFEQLDSLDLDNVKPTITVGQEASVMREDKVGQQVVDNSSLLSVAPHTKDGYIQVERMI